MDGDRGPRPEVEPWYIRQARAAIGPPDDDPAPRRQYDIGRFTVSEPVRMAGRDEPTEIEERLASTEHGTGATPLTRTVDRATRWPWYAGAAAAVLVMVGGGILLADGDAPATPTVARPAAIAAVPAARPAVGGTARLNKQLGAARAMCAAPDTFDGLRAVLFGTARQADARRAPQIEWLAERVSLRIEGPDVKALAANGSATVCVGMLVLELPSGQFEGGDAVGYTIQPGVDARGLVYALRGAEPLVRRVIALAPMLAPVPAEPVPVATPDAAQPAIVAAAAPRPAKRRARPAAPRKASGTETAPRAPEIAPVSDATVVPRPSCGEGSSTVDRMVCASPPLTALDMALTTLTSGVAAMGDERRLRKMRDGEAKFQAKRAACATEACVAKLYRVRIESLSDLLRPEATGGQTAQRRARQHLS